MITPKAPSQPRSITIDPNPKGELKRIGGSLADEWNLRLLNLVGGSMPIDHSDRETSNEAIKAVIQATADIAPADPIEGILIAQLMAANEASLAMYRKGWAQPPEYFAARTKYLQLADKATRTVMMLTERLDHHRGRGQQQITVKHVTTNNVTADQAIIADSVAKGGATRSNVASPALLATSSERPMPMLIEAGPDPVGAGGGTKSK
ncbi:hypothetical protein [Bradyrhizobium sp. sBnM-33]|uniref:hypothetical protein n=1 Tax=Bradyrhizobium sp. sBnM-33 TaxID=2831780 RepID=UPI001BD0C49C|nr:hypothetical protein [Bradyrhizobium sp. sBnM-33]WOH47651.1 hypothetical protein RX328_26155 [Bradyrhizobium sp. sBnM-33]